MNDVFRQLDNGVSEFKYVCEQLYQFWVQAILKTVFLNVNFCQKITESRGHGLLSWDSFSHVFSVFGSKVLVVQKC